MANIDRSAADTAGFIPQAWAAKALDVLRSNITLAKVVARDSDFNDPGWQGKTLNIPFPGTFTAQAKASSTLATVQTPSGGASVPVTLSQHEYVDFIVEDFAAAQANEDLMMRYVQPAAVALAEKVEGDLFALYASLTGTSAGTAGTDLTAAVIRSARKGLNDAKAPQSDRSLIVSTKDEISLMGDTNLSNYFAFARPDVIEKGAIANLYGFDVYVSQLVPTTGSAPVNTHNIAMHKNAMMLVTRPFNPIEPNAGVSSAIMNDDASGLSIRVLHQYSIGNRGMYVGFDILYGVVALRPTVGLVALS